MIVEEEVVVKASEHSYRARNLEAPQYDHLVTTRDEWFLGFASALAQIWRLRGDGLTVRHILAASNLGLKHLENAGVDDFDLSAIRAAMASQ